MALQVTMTMVGIRRVDRMLRKGAPAAAHRAMPPALNQAGTLTLRTMRALVPVQRVRKASFGVPGAALVKPEKKEKRPGNLKRSLTRKYVTFKASEYHLLMLGPGVKGGRKGFHGHLVEAGTKPRIQDTTGRSTGTMPAIRFMERAMDATHAQATRIVARVFGARLLAEIQRGRG